MIHKSQSRYALIIIDEKSRLHTIKLKEASGVFTATPLFNYLIVGVIWDFKLLDLTQVYKNFLDLKDIEKYLFNSSNIHFILPPNEFRAGGVEYRIDNKPSGITYNTYTAIEEILYELYVSPTSETTATIDIIQSGDHVDIFAKGIIEYFNADTETWDFVHLFHEPTEGVSVLDITGLTNVTYLRLFIPTEAYYSSPHLFNW